MKKSKIFPFIMLLVKWSGAAVVDGRGKLGGTVFSKSRAGATARNKVTPINRRSTAQQLRRAVFGALSQAWRTLTQTQRNGWNALANTAFTSTNIFGDVVKKAGNALFIALNANLNLVEQNTISDPPNVEDTAAPAYALEATADVSATQLFLTTKFDAGLEIVPADNYLAIYATPKLSPGVSYVNSQFRFLGYIGEGETTSSFNLWGPYSGVYGAPAVGDNIAFRVQTINGASGASGVPLQGTLVISA